MSKFKIDTFTVLLLFVCLIYTPFYNLIPVFTAILLHELAHIIAAVAMKIKIKQIELNILGARIHTKNNLFSYKKEIILSAAGPLMNLLIFFIIHITFEFWENDIIKDFAFYNLTLGILNLLPMEGFDGGRIFKGLLAQVFSFQVVNSFSRFLSFFVLFILWIISVYFLIRAGASLALFAFCSALFSKMIKKDVFI